MVGLLVANERITENYVREKLRENGYYEADNGVVIEEQKSLSPLKMESWTWN